MIKLAITLRIENYDKEIPFNKRYYLDSYFKDIFDKLDVMLIPIVSNNNLRYISQICDGLIVTGSFNDVHPKYYNEEAINEKAYKYDEFGLIKETIDLFVKQNKPILGICAGLQEINVAFGGSLNQLIDNHRLTDGQKHRIQINQESFLYKVYKEKTIMVNSYHKQSIKNLASNFSVTALSDDGVIEAIEKDNIIAVQWHPEVLYDMQLFETFIKEFF